MAKIIKFEDLIVWQKSGQLAFDIYKNFRHCRDFSFRDQIQRAGVSVMNNIAEGFERENKNDFKRFLKIARGSCGEVRSMSYLALRLKYISNDNFQEIHSFTVEISRMLTGLIKKI